MVYAKISILDKKVLLPPILTKGVFPHPTPTPDPQPPSCNSMFFILVRDRSFLTTRWPVPRVAAVHNVYDTYIRISRISTIRPIFPKPILFQNIVPVAPSFKDVLPGFKVARECLPLDRDLLWLTDLSVGPKLSVFQMFILLSQGGAGPV